MLLLPPIFGKKLILETCELPLNNGLAHAFYEIDDEIKVMDRTEGAAEHFVSTVEVAKIRSRIVFTDRTATLRIERTHVFSVLCVPDIDLPF